MDMLDAGINMPKMVNMVFFKPVQSKMKILNILTKILNLFSEKDIDKIFNNIDYFNRVLIA
jgi:type I site-specific restriction endonuclease